MPLGIASVVGRKWKVREGTGNNSNCIPNISLQKGSQKGIGYLLQLKIPYMHMGLRIYLGIT